jgi:hypothetical protein
MAMGHGVRIVRDMIVYRTSLKIIRSALPKMAYLLVNNGNYRDRFNITVGDL